MANDIKQFPSFLGRVSFFQFLRDLNRLRHIVTVLFGVGFAESMRTMELNWFVSLSCRVHCWFSKQTCPQEDLPQRIRVAFERLGPTFMKLGQVLSMRPDLIPEAYVQEFSKLQDHAPAFPFDIVQNIVASELKQPLENIFAEFEKEPIASASLGQVHRARLLNGAYVAIKVQRPGIKGILQKDMRLIAYFMRRLEQRFPEVRRLRPRDALDAFIASLERELDYRIEGRNADRFRYNFRDEKGIVTPAIFWDYTTERVLTMEFMVGTKMGDRAALKRQGIDHDILMRNCTRACLLPVFRDGFFHADPHPGNVWALQDGRVCWLDFGMVGSVPKKLRLNMLFFTLFVAQNDIESALYYLLEMANVHDGSDVDGYSEEVTAILTSLYAHTGAVQTISSSFFLMVQKASEFSIYFPAGMVLLAKALVTSETMCRLSHNNYDILETAKPILEEVYQKEFGISALLSQFQKFMPDLMMFLQRMPNVVRREIARDEHTHANRRAHSH